MNERGGMEIASVRIGGERTADRKAVVGLHRLNGEPAGAMTSCIFPQVMPL